MASITMSTALPDQAHSPGAISVNNTSLISSDPPSPLPSPLSDLSPGFVFPDRKSEELTDPVTIPTMSVPRGGLHSRRASRQGRAALPEFTFNPGATMTEPTSPQPSPSPKTHPILEEMAANSRNYRSGRPSPLPAFTFNPGSPAELQRTPSPTKPGLGESSVRTPIHRRGVSEFMGSEGTVAVLSTSPVKSESPPPKAPLASRGHRHKRSGALSVAEVDLSSIIKANAMAKHRIESTPSTPADTNNTTFSEIDTLGSPSSPNSKKSALATPPASPGRRESAPGSLPRPRVAFSDTVAEIPRPLSLISSETDGSNSTVRASQSFSGNVNFATISPRSSTSLSLLRDDEGSPRPQSAGEQDVTFRMDDLPSPGTSPKRPLSMSGTPSSTSGSRSPPPKRNHFWETTPESDDNKDQENGTTDSANTESSLPIFAPTEAAETERPRTSPERKASVKKRKVRTWTGSIFSRKGKQRASRPKGRRTPTPPLVITPGLDDVFDNDDGTVVVEEPLSAPARLPMLDTRPRTMFSSNTEISSFGVEDRNVISPVIDLDAALGPFGSDERFSSSNASYTAWRKLHSAQSIGEPGSPYHRRAESAPHLPPVSRNIFGFGRMGSNPSMSEDVFDEEEEDDYLAKRRDGAESPVLVRGVVKDHAAKPSETMSEVVTPFMEGTAAIDDGIEIVEDRDDMSHVGDRSSGSTIIQPMTSDMIPKRPASVPIDFAFPSTQQSYASSGEGPSAPNSAISSPEDEQLSFEGQQRRMRRLVEPNNDHFLRPSTDDVPSLTDSVSTATGHVPRVSSSGNIRVSSDQRSASFSGLATWSAARTSKRASLVSLTRLIPGSSHGERSSKLRFGEVAEKEEQEKQKRKSSRLSRLVTFWRPRDKA